MINSSFKQALQTENDLQRRRFILGILCLVSAIYFYMEINAMFSFPQPVLNAISSQFSSFSFSNPPPEGVLYSKAQILKDVQACNTFGGNLGALGNLSGLCAVMQAYYYSPWILGIVGVIALVYSRSHYYGSRNRNYR